MRFSKVSQEEISEFFLADPELCQLGLQDCDLASLEKDKVFPYYPESYWLGVRIKDKLVSIVRIELFTPISVLCHIYVNSKYHKTGMLRKVKDTTVSHLQKTTEFRHIVVPVPATCSHVVGPLESFGFKKVGCMKNMIVWRGRAVDLLWYQLEIK